MTNPRRQSLIWVLSMLVIVGLFGWFTFRMTRRLAVEPYVDFHAFYLAADAARTGLDPYRVGTEMYIYPPMLAAWMTPITALTEIQAAWWWYALTVVGTITSLSLVWLAVSKQLQLPLTLSALAAAMAVTVLDWSTQIRWELEQGQTDWLMLLPLCIMLLSMNRVPWLAGLMLGFAINIKYLPLAFLLYFAVRRRWNLLGWSLLGIVMWALMPAFIYGWDRNLTFLGQGFAGLAKIVGVQIEGQAGYVFPLTYDRSVTIPSMLARMAGESSNTMVLVALGTLSLACLCMLVMWRMFRENGVSLFVGRGGRAEKEPRLHGISLLEVTLLFALMIAFSPQAMMRHYYLVLPVVMVAATLALGAASRSARVYAVLALLVGVLGSIGADVWQLWGAREAWKFYSGMAYCTVVMACLTLHASLLHLRKIRAVAKPQRVETPAIATECLLTATTVA